jgi:nucleoside-diphosphate-sugar epimerase
MRIFITGEKGFIGSNLAARMKLYNNITFVSGERASDMLMHTAGEPCIHSNDVQSWQNFFQVNEIDVVIHNAATVGTDVVALNSKDSTLTNVQGTYNICRAAKHLSIPVCYMGTTVIYDTKKYQNTNIIETSDRGPHTLYGCQKLCAEDIVKSQTSRWMIVRPLFAYGGIGDMNSLIAKTIYASLNNKSEIDMFLDPTKIKDYMHVNDFCDAVLAAVNTGMWYQDWNIAAETPVQTGEIISMISELTGLAVKDTVVWHPMTDYLGNHRLTSSKFKSVCKDWKPQIDLASGILMSFKSILASKGYNPLKHLEDAKNKNIDLTEFY